jgi:hypothetical protein
MGAEGDTGPGCWSRAGPPASWWSWRGSNLLLVPLDRRGEWYRYHHLFRDMLLAELHRLEPGLVPVLQRRAAAWCLGNGLAEEALEYSMAAGDVDTVAELAQRLGVLVYRQGRVPTVRRWFGWLEERGGHEGHPMIAVLASMLSAAAGRPADTERWADAVDRWQYADPARPDDPTAEAWAAMIRAFYLSGAGLAAVTAAAVHAPVDPGDRRGSVPVPQHHQVRGELDLPQARRRLPQPGHHPVPRAWAPGRLTAGLSRHRGDATRPIAGGAWT